MLPFHIHYDLTRRARFGPLAMLWMPCLAPCIGFTLGIAFLSLVMTPWFLPLLVVPVIPLSRGFIPGVVGIVARRFVPVEVTVDGDRISLQIGIERTSLPLDGVMQVFRVHDRAWEVIHVAGPILRIPADAITAEQVEYLKAIALRGARQRQPI